MNLETLFKIFNTNAGTLAFALFGALCLTFLSIKEHADKPENDKMPNGQYFLYLLGWLILYPILGVGVATAYLANDNQFGAWMALQIGLTSPAIVIGITKGGANRMAQNGVVTEPGQ
jgi:cytochrome c oxidase assembly factor CtaG